MKPRIEILPPQQKLLWPELAAIPKSFVLYGGTSIALRLGHRESVDFDFFTERSVAVDSLVQQLPFLLGASLLQSSQNSLTFSVARHGAVKISFLGGLTFGRVGLPDRCEDNGLLLASMLDLAAHKMKIILTRAELRDYLDIHALLSHGIRLEEALGAAEALFPEFNPILALKALTYFGEENLKPLADSIRDSHSRGGSDRQRAEADPRLRRNQPCGRGLTGGCPSHPWTMSQERASTGSNSHGSPTEANFV